ncbi:MAG: aldehyde dehydrogenase [Candidatus Thermoplasmatota archaeon]|nr:aldehyde dehydrogenase [Candidatus Thermoplasmatota archaeon]
MHIQNFIGGKFVKPTNNDYIENHNPAENTVIAKIPNSSFEDIELAVEAANDAFQGWSNLPIEKRIEWLRKIGNALELKKLKIAELESIDTGKPISLATRVDAERSIRNFNFFADQAENLAELRFEMDDATNFVHRKPIGIVGLITPWNLPLYLLTWKIAPALVMGNTIIAKPSEMTPLTANLLCEILQSIDFPSGVINVVQGLGKDVGQAIVEHPKIRAISFTGGTVTGKSVAATAAPMFKKLSLELGGKNATIVLDDADISVAAKGAARAAFTNSGQVCLCGSRILVASSIYSQFVDALIEEIDAMKVGNPKSQDTDIGSVISQSHMEKVLSYINLAEQEGGTILTGGSSLSLDEPNADGFFVAPTLIGGLAIDSRCATEEIFGPVATIHRFETDQDAISMANITEYGLAGSVWTTNTTRGKTIAEQIDSGVLWVNTWLHRDLRTPFGGVKNSGVGREGGDWSLNFFSEFSNICVIND